MNTENKIEQTANGLSLVKTAFPGKIIATANSTEIAKEIVGKWNVHNELIEALEYALSTFKLQGQEEKDWTKRIEAAIEKAKP